ncbi:hypothetical protein DFH07DRAFT_776089 [Mycena maculata]|uniref:Uncharacterized protein n=1 Tax=Mycena maculata TaxID=230809 RepID=A0AAD7N596_9AGAR|nr:hypothetical protein DFH07DRAFT_776089 [Mycena maculata]
MSQEYLQRCHYPRFNCWPSRDAKVHNVTRFIWGRQHYSDVRREICGGPDGWEERLGAQTFGYGTCGCHLERKSPGKPLLNLRRPLVYGKDFIRLTPKLISLGADGQKFLSTLNTFKALFHDVVSESHKHAISTADYTEGLDISTEQKIEKSIKVGTPLMCSCPTHDWRQDGDNMSSSTVTLKSRITDLKAQLETFTHIFSTWVQARQEKNEQEVTTLRFKIKKIPTARRHSRPPFMLLCCASGYSGAYCGGPNSLHVAVVPANAERAANAHRRWYKGLKFRQKHCSKPRDDSEYNPETKFHGNVELSETFNLLKPLMYVWKLPITWIYHLKKNKYEFCRAMPRPTPQVILSQTGCIFAGVELASLASVIIAKNDVTKEKRRRGVQISELQSAPIGVKRMRAQLEDEGETDRNNITTLDRVWFTVHRAVDTVTQQLLATTVSRTRPIFRPRLTQGWRSTREWEIICEIMLRE